MNLHGERFEYLKHFEILTSWKHFLYVFYRIENKTYVIPP